MRHLLIVFAFALFIFVLTSFERLSLRSIYSRPSSTWPAPLVENGVKWQELAALPLSPLAGKMDSLKNLIALGKVLFFDPRLSLSGKISCSSCHQPQLYWTDGKPKSFGHEGAINKRNAPTIENVWYYERLFRDGRSADLEDQAFAPINSESEMHSDMAILPHKLQEIKGYPVLFDAAFGDPHINAERIATAIATFERTVTSGESRFDKFLQGDRAALSNEELRGLHVFRTRAGCMNCHNGPMLADNQFHRAVSIYYEQQPDEGRYRVTHEESDMGKFKTASLRNVMKTGPWMHHGMDDDMIAIVDLYSKRMPLPSGRSFHPALTAREKRSLIAFLNSLTAAEPVVERPVLPD
jgi:cytochrome c peroxidase